MSWTDGSDETKWSSGYRIDWTPLYKDVSSLKVIGYTEPKNGTFSDGVDFILEKLDAIPEADVEPVIHAHWIRTGDYITYKNNGYAKRMEEKVCSVCGAFAPYTKFGKQYCPLRCSCGAKMDEKETEQ